jgi:ATP/maltotriose-dependent transcriptional regulator MalT
VLRVTGDSAMAAFKRGDTGEARRLAERHLALGERAGSATDVAALCMLSRVALREGDFAAAAEHADSARQAALQSDNPSVLQEPVHLRAAIARLRGDLPAARQNYLASIDLNLHLGQTKAVAVEQRNLAYVELHLGDLQEARRRLALAHEGADPAGADAAAPNDLLDSAALAAAAANFADAAILLQRTRQRYAEIGEVPDPDEEEEMTFLERLIQPMSGSQH